MPSWKGVREWAESSRKVDDWAQHKFTDEHTKAHYVYHLKKVCEALDTRPESFLSFLNGRPSRLYGRLRRYLVAESTKYYRTGHLEKAAVVSFVSYHNNRPQKFALDVPLKKRQKFERPQWGVTEYQQVLENIHRKYRPLIKLGVMAGLGGKELCFLNEHADDVKAVPNVAEAVYLSSMPARKSNEKLWTAILPAKEFQELKKVAPIKTFGRGKGVADDHGRLGKRDPAPIQRDDLTVNFKIACERAGIRVTGTAVHILRAIFESVALSHDPGPNIPKRYLDQNMGHIDREHYDRTHKNLQERASIMRQKVSRLEMML